MRAVEEHRATLGVVVMCAALALARATFYRRRSPKPPREQRSPSLRALSPVERQAVLDTLHEPRFVDLAPAEVYATLLDEGRYLCSERTMYRVLEENHEVRERRDQLRHPSYTKPELLATAPNQLWSWDITKLLGPAKWTYFYLYVILDVFSRYVVGWMVGPRKNRRRSPSGSSRRPAGDRTSSRGSSRCTPTAARRCAPSRSRCSWPTWA